MRKLMVLIMIVASSVLFYNNGYANNENNLFDEEWHNWKKALIVLHADDVRLKFSSKCFTAIQHLDIAESILYGQDTVTQRQSDILNSLKKKRDDYCSVSGKISEDTYSFLDDIWSRMDNMTLEDVTKEVADFTEKMKDYASSGLSK